MSDRESFAAESGPEAGSRLGKHGSKERVAVVAVHGVGNHEEGSSAQAMADLLLGLNAYTNAAAGSPYSGFDAAKIEVPLPGPGLFATPQPGRGSLWYRLCATFEERRGFFADKFRLRKWRRGRAPLRNVDLNDEFIVTQLGEYTGDPLCSKYESVRLEGARSAPAGRAALDVHIYEMHWADLAKRDNSFIRFFMSFYQLLIHLCSLGRTAIDHVALEHAGSLPWLLLQRSYSYATRVLTLGMFTFLVLLPVVAFAPITKTLKNGTAGAAATAVVVLLAASVAALVMWKSRPLFRDKHWLFFLSFALMVCLAATGAAFTAPFFLTTYAASSFVLGLAWWAVSFAIVFWIFKNYDQVRAGAKEAGLIGMTLVAAGFLVCLRWAAHNGQDQQAYDAAAFLMIQYTFLVLRCLWIALLLLALFAWIMEFVCIRRTKVAEEKARARAAFHTGRLALAVPTLLLLLLTMFTWSGAFYYIWDRVPLYQTKKTLPEAPLPGFLQIGAIRCNELPGLLKLEKPALCKDVKNGKDVPEKDVPEANRRELAALLLQSAPVGLPLVLTLMGIGFLLLILLAAPSAFQEFKHPLKATNRAARLLGEWLSGAFSAFPATVYCFWLAAFGLPAVYIFAAIVYHFAGHQGKSFMFNLYTWLFHDFIATLTFKSGPIVAAVAVFLVTAGKPIFKSASTVLDIILDVDNYLRTSPATRTPRARVVERYVGLLHYLHQQPYDRIVIVAHSLGALISADVLRFLKHRRIPALSGYAFADRDPESIPIRLFTMGSPLRQLLNRFFPHLYTYIRPVPDGCREAPMPPVPVPPARPLPPASAGVIPAKAKPQLDDLGLDAWVNCYRSGDYVGRSLWLDDWMKRTNDGDDAGEFPSDLQATAFGDAGGKRVEACIGLGAHTHYWDRSAPDIGDVLDALIG